MGSVRVCVSRAGWLPSGVVSWCVTDHEWMLVMSEEDVTEDAARLMAGCWRRLVEAGHWTWGDVDSLPVISMYEMDPDLPGNVPCGFLFEGGLVRGRFNPDHFTEAGVEALRGVAAESAVGGWSWVAKVPAVAAALNP